MIKWHKQGRFTMIALLYQAPDPQLAPFVSSLYRFDYDGEARSELERADRPQFRIQLRGTTTYVFEAGHERPAFPITIIGPTTAPIKSTADGPQTIVGWGMTPTGWAALMGKEAGKWVDEALDASRAFGEGLMELRQELMEAVEAEAQFAIMQRAASEIFAKSDKAPFEFTTMIDHWLLTNNEHDIDALIAQSGLSPRQLERTTSRYYGMPPKKLARKYRALRAAHKLAAGDSLDDTDLGLSFYDQSHLIREIKQFTGLTPGQLKSGQSELTAATMRGRAGLGGKVSPLISES
jgi:AraC-like DNA-binding protein